MAELPEYVARLRKIDERARVTYILLAAEITAIEDLADDVEERYPLLAFVSKQLRAIHRRMNDRLDALRLLAKAIQLAELQLAQTPAQSATVLHFPQRGGGVPGTPGIATAEQNAAAFPDARRSAGKSAGGAG